MFVDANVDWSKCHNGLMLCSWEETQKLMPEVVPVITPLIPTLEKDISEYVIDVKVHKLMPGEWPCIPNWHFDFVPRTSATGKRLLNERVKDKMYIWISNSPLTEFKNRKGSWFIKEKTWTPFTQYDLHRGTQSEEHTWRGFIRIIPTSFIHPGTQNINQIRRHSQVYLDAETFTW